jgi:hypothetical protein
MPLILEPGRYDERTLETLHAEMLEGLREAAESVEAPRGPVLDPGGLERARDLIEAARSAIARAGPRDRARLASDINLAYAATLAAIDLLKCHTDVPRVPRSRASTPP